MSDDTATTPETTDTDGPQPPYDVQVPQPYRNTPFETLPPAIQQQISRYSPQYGSEDPSQSEVEPGARESADETEAMAAATQEQEPGSDVPPPGGTSQAAMVGEANSPGISQNDEQSDASATLDAGRDTARDTAAETNDSKPGSVKKGPASKLP